MKTKRIALSAGAALVLGLAGALAGNSHALAANGLLFESAAGLSNSVELCIATSGEYAVTAVCDIEANDQIWNRTYEYETYGYYQYENDNGLCLSVFGGGTEENERIGAGTCNGSHLDQYWAIDYAGEIDNYIVNFHSNQYVTIANNSLAPGAELVQHGEDIENIGEFQEWVEIPGA